MSKAILNQVILDIISKHTAFGGGTTKNKLVLKTSSGQLARDITDAVLHHFKTLFWSKMRDFFVSTVLE